MTGEDLENWTSLKNDPITKSRVYRSKDLEKIGTKYGGWVIPSNNINKHSVCLCAGAGEDVSFEYEVANRFNCRVIICDPTPSAIIHHNNIRNSISKGKKISPGEPSRYFYPLNKSLLNLIDYHEVGLSDKSGVKKFYAPKNIRHTSYSIVNLQKTKKYIEVNCMRLSEIIKEENIEGLDLIKLDIEGAEYQVIKSIIDDNLKVNVICVEFDEIHNPLNSNYKKRIKNTIDMLIENKFLIVAIDGYSNYTFVKKGVYLKSLINIGRYLFFKLLDFGNTLRKI